MARSRILKTMIVLMISLELLSSSGAMGSISPAGSNKFVQPLVSPDPLNLNITLKGAGASFPAPLIQQAWVPAYHQANPNVTINYNSVGSGKGQAAVLNKTVDFGASDAPLNSRQRALYPNILHIPETIGSVTASYNLPGILRGALNLNGTILADIYLGSIKVWNDSRIKALNSPTIDALLPYKNITTVHRLDSSGTTFVFTSFLCLDSKTWCSQVGNGTAVLWPNGIASNFNIGVANTVNSTQDSIGYVELAYAEHGNLTYAKLQNPAGNFILPTEQATAWAVTNSSSILPPSSAADWSKFNLLNAGGGATYPIASFTYFLVYQQTNVVPSMDSVDQVQFLALQNFLNWAVTIGQTYSNSPTFSYVPLPANVVALDQAGIASMKFTEISTPTTRSISLHINSSGWNFTNPGPSITVVTGDHLTINLNATDSLPHQWYIDFNNNGILDANESGASSTVFNTPGPTQFPFNPVIWNQHSIPAAGTYTYRDANNPTLVGSITILPQQVAAVFTDPAVDFTCPKNTPANKCLPQMDTSRVGTVGSLVIDMRTKLAYGNVTMAAADNSTLTLTYTHTYVISAFTLGSVSGITGQGLRFAVAGLTISPFALSSNIQVQLQGTTATTRTLLSRDLDVNGDGGISIDDIGLILNAYGTVRGGVGYNPNADVMNNGVINIADMGPMLAWYGFIVLNS